MIGMVVEIKPEYGKGKAIMLGMDDGDILCAAIEPVLYDKEYYQGASYDVGDLFFAKPTFLHLVANTEQPSEARQRLMGGL